MKMDPHEFDRIARGIFAPVYPVIAAQILDRTGIRKGVCLDIGCGGGYLGAALAKETELFVHFFDASAEMLAIAEQTISKHGLEKRADTLQGDVSSIALPDGSVHLAVSRGSIFFWKDLARAFAEIYRLLAPDGSAYIGGGFGSKALKEQIECEMASRDREGENFRARVRQNLGDDARTRFESALKVAGIPSYTILQDENIGLWIVIKKGLYGPDQL